MSLSSAQVEKLAAVPPAVRTGLAVKDLRLKIKFFGFSRLPESHRTCEKMNRHHHRGAETHSKSFLFRLCACVSLWFDRLPPQHNLHLPLARPMARPWNPELQPPAPPPPLHNLILDRDWSREHNLDETKGHSGFVLMRIRLALGTAPRPLSGRPAVPRGMPVRPVNLQSQISNLLRLTVTTLCILAKNQQRSPHHRGPETRSKSFLFRLCPSAVSVV